MKTSQAHTQDIDNADTLEFDPWEKILQLLQDQRKDIKDIKYQIKVLNSNIELVRQAQHTESRRITILETKSSQRDSAYPVGMTPLPMEAVRPDTD